MVVVSFYIKTSARDEWGDPEMYLICDMFTLEKTMIEWKIYVSYVTDKIDPCY